MSEPAKVLEVVTSISGVHPTDQTPAPNIEHTECSHPWPSGVTFGEYDVESFIGFGGWASVYRAHHPVHGTVALKVMSEKHLENEGALERFEREQELLARVQHTNVVRSYDGGIIGESPYLAMELLSGEDLDATVMRRQALEPGAVVAILDQALAALQAVHDADVVHRDIKPSNLFVDITAGTPRIVLVDFGIALGGGDRLTEEGRINGTPHYLSPEQVGGQDVNDPRVDVFAAGVVAYELLSGSTPFPSLGLGELMIAILQRDAPKLPNVPEALYAIVAKAMARDIDERYQSADEFREALLSWAESASVPAVLEAGGFGIVPKSTVPLTLRPLTRSTSSKLREKRARAKRKAAAKGVLAVACVVLCMLAAFRFGAATESEPSAAPVSADNSAAEAPAVLGMHPPANAAEQMPAEDSEEEAAGAPAESRRAAAEATEQDAPEQGAPEQGAPEQDLQSQEGPNVESLLAAARQHHLRGRHTEAMRTYRQATRAERRNAEAWRGLGLVSIRLGLNAQARASLRRYLRLAPGASDRAQVRRQLADLTP